MNNKVFYSKGKYILYGNPELRNSFIVCQTFNILMTHILLKILNKGFIFKK